jgi:hypothetical protein
MFHPSYHWEDYSIVSTISEACVRLDLSFRVFTTFLKTSVPTTHIIVSMTMTE